MFDRVMDWLETAASATPESSKDSTDQGFGDHDIQVCVAALFYHMVAVDGVVTDEEAEKLRQILSERYQLDEEQLAQLAQDGEESDRQSAGLFPFTVILNRQMDASQRQMVFDQLQQLAMADGVIDDLEQNMLDHVKVLLKLSDSQ
ncbi:MAG: TerB family tellurite resistance protein [Rhizobiaceae bacterium]